MESTLVDMNLAHDCIGDSLAKMIAEAKEGGGRCQIAQDYY